MRLSAAYRTNISEFERLHYKEGLAAIEKLMPLPDTSDRERAYRTMRYLRKKIAEVKGAIW